MDKIKLPSIEDYQNHTGLHYKNLWQAIDDNWKCPACRRTKFQIMRWTKRFPNTPRAFMDWVAALHRHHDHSVTTFNQKKLRFCETVICDQCNSADGTAKKKLKLPKEFSFSPDEIGQFVITTPHGKHQINYHLAWAIYEQLNKAN